MQYQRPQLKLPPLVMDVNEPEYSGTTLSRGLRLTFNDFYKLAHIYFKITCKIVHRWVIKYTENSDFLLLSTYTYIASL